MRLVMPIGYEDFAEVRRDYYYVDKTGFLCDFLKAHAKVTMQGSIALSLTGCGSRAMPR